MDQYTNVWMNTTMNNNKQINSKLNKTQVKQINMNKTKWNKQLTINNHLYGRNRRSTFPAFFPQADTGTLKLAT